MSHEVENYSNSAGSYSELQYSLYNRLSSNCVPYLVDGYPRIEKSGYVTWPSSSGGRDASHHTSYDKRNRWRNPTPYWAWKFDVERVVPTFYRVETASTAGCTGRYDKKVYVGTDGRCHDTFGSVKTTPTVPQYLIDSAKIGCLNDFKTKSVDLSLVFAERKKTVNFVVDCLQGVIDVARDVRKGRVPMAIKRWRNYPDKWLAYRYGWLPMVMDAYGAVKALERAEDGTYSRAVVTGKCYEEVASDSTAPVNVTVRFGTSSSYLSYWVPGVKKTQLTHSCFYRIDATINNATYLRLQDVGVTDPASTAWELIPYSFVVDWFINVGDWLGAVNALEGWNPLACSRTLVTRETVEVTTQTGGTYPVTQWFEGDKLGSTAFAFVRESDDFTVPTPVFSRNPLNLTRLADGISLLAGLLKGTSSGGYDLRRLRI